MLEGAPLEILPMDFFWGRFIIKEKFSELVKYSNRKTGEDKTALAEKSRWITKSTTMAARDEEVENLKNKAIYFISNPA